MDRIVASDLPILALLIGSLAAVGALIIWRWGNPDRTDRLNAKYGEPIFPLFIVFGTANAIDAAIDRLWLKASLSALGALCFLWGYLRERRRARAKSL